MSERQPAKIIGRITSLVVASLSRAYRRTAEIIRPVGETTLASVGLLLQSAKTRLSRIPVPRVPRPKIPRPGIVPRLLDLVWRPLMTRCRAAREWMAALPGRVRAARDLPRRIKPALTGAAAATSRGARRAIPQAQTFAQATAARMGQRRDARRATHGVDREHQAHVRLARRQLRKVRRHGNRQVKRAAKRLRRIHPVGLRPLVRYRGLLVFEDRVVTARGVARLDDGPVRANVHQAAFVDDYQLIVDTPRFSSVIRCRKRKAWRLAEKINKIALSAPAVGKERWQKASIVRRELETAKAARDERIRAAELRLETVQRHRRPESERTR